jgi:hypothetical protein
MHAAWFGTSVVMRVCECVLYVYMCRCVGAPVGCGWVVVLMWRAISSILTHEYVGRWYMATVIRGSGVWCR